MAVTESNIKVEPVDVFWGAREKTKITTVADSSGSLSGTYFTLANHDASTLYYAWFDVDNGSTDPAPAGRTGIEVDIAQDASASAVASALKAALDAESDFAALSSGAVVTLENNNIGASEDVADVDTGFTFEQLVDGSKDDLGGTSGGVSIAMEFNAVDVVADQLGGGDGTLLDQIQLSTNTTVSMTLLEMTADRWSLIVGQVIGDEHTPSGGTKLTGLGESKRYRNLKQFSRELVLKPSNSSDDSRNINLWKAYPAPASINFDNELQGMEVEWRVFRDDSRPEAVSVMAFGDGAQDVLDS